MKLFIDFDGTITKHDVGNAFFKEFGRRLDPPQARLAEGGSVSGEICAEYIAGYRTEKISAKELFRSETAAIGLLDEKKAKMFLHQQPIDESFKRFVEFCRERAIEFHVVSDGLDYYIEEILSHNDIQNVSFFANRFELVPLRVYDFVEGRRPTENCFAKPSISFPYDDAECTRCACCKRNIMLTNTSDDDVIVYIGEGYSDRCPAQYADIVFAKDELQKFCQEKNISYFLYESFDDVVMRLKELLSKKRLKKRREAEMKRREAFIRE